MIIDPCGGIPAERLSTVTLEDLGVIPIANGGTGATTKAAAVQNLGLAEVITKIFSAREESAYINEVTNYVDENLSVGSGVFAFNAQGAGSYGTAIAWQTSEDIKALLLCHRSLGVRFYVWSASGGWTQASWT